MNEASSGQSLNAGSAGLLPEVSRGEALAVLNRQQYFLLANKLNDRLQGKGYPCSIPAQLEDKTSFGDIDLVIIPPENFVLDAVKKLFGTDMVEVKLDGTVGMGNKPISRYQVVNLTLNTNEAISPGFTYRVDLSLVTNQSESDFTTWYLSKSYNNSLLSMVYDYYGYKLGHRGLYKKIPDSKEFVTQNIHQALALLDYSLEDWYNVRNRNQAVEYIVHNKFFKPEIFKSALQKKGNYKSLATRRPDLYETVVCLANN